MKQAMNYLIAGLIGLVGGMTSGLFGVGGGIVMVPAMTLLMHMNFKLAVGTSLVVIVPTALVGAFQHTRFDHVDWRVAGLLVPMALAGGFIGPWLVTQLPTFVLRRAFGVALVAVGIRLILMKPPVAS